MTILRQHCGRDVIVQTSLWSITEIYVEAVEWMTSVACEGGTTSNI